MEFLEGQSLRSIITSCEGTRETVPLPTTLRVVHDALLGLHYAHELADYDGRPAGIVHRDVSPTTSSSPTRA